jgi:ABC-type transport system involved in multi-copper enzyme maturation permease subunit
MKSKTGFPHPLTRKELLARMRSRATPTFITLFLLICSGIAFMIYLIGVSSGARRVGSANESGTLLFYFIVAMQLIAAAFIVPAFSSGAIAAEAQRGTLDLLRAASIGARQILISKFVSALAYGLIFVGVTLPLLSLALFLGSIEPADLLIALTVVLATTLLFVTLSIYISSRTGTRAVASGVIYAVAAAIMVGMPIVALIGVRAIQEAYGASVVTGGALVMRDVIEGAFSILISLSPFTAILASRTAYGATGDLFLYRQPIIGATTGVTLPSPFITLTLVYIVFALILLALAERRLR